MSENPDWDPRELKKKKKEKKAKKRARAPQRRQKKKKKRKLMSRGEQDIEEQQQMLDNELFPGEADYEDEIEPSVYDKTVMALKSKPRKRKGEDEDLNNELEAYSKQFIADMVLAAKRDRERLMAHPPKPAFSCFKMISKLEENTQREKLFRLMLDNNLLCALRDWMQPYPNGMLPVKQVRDRLYDMLGACKLHRFDDIKDIFEASQLRTDEAIRRKEIAPDTVGFCKTVMQL